MLFLRVVDSADPLHLVGGSTGGLSPFSLVTRAEFRPVPILLLVLAVVAYTRAVRTVRAQQDGPGWGREKDVAFAVAMVALAVGTLSGLGAFARSSFVVVAVQIGLISLVAPVFLALSAPVTLALSVSSGTRRDRIVRTTNSRGSMLVANPLVGAGIFMAWYFVYFFTPLLRLGLDNSIVELAVDAALLLVGCIFTWPLAAIDPLPRRLGHGHRMVWLLLTLPYFTILGMTLESQSRRIAPLMSLADIHAGGGVLWVTGETVGLIGLLAVLITWCRVEESEATRRDDAGDRQAATQLAHWKANRRAAAIASGLISPDADMDAGPEGSALRAGAIQRSLGAGPQ